MKNNDKKYVYVQTNGYLFNKIKEFEKEYGFRENEISHIIQNDMIMDKEDFHNILEVISERVMHKLSHLEADFDNILKKIDNLTTYIDKPEECNNPEVLEYFKRR